MRQLLATLRHRPAPLVGTFVALVVTAMVVTWAFALGNAGGTANVPVQRLANASVVVTGDQSITITYGTGKNPTTDVRSLASYRRVPAALATTLAKLPGVRAAVADQSVPLALELSNGRVVTGTSVEPTTGYGWRSAALTPFRLDAGHAPAGAHELVIGRGLADSTKLRVGDEVRLAGQPLSPFSVVGIVNAPSGDPAGQWSVFLSDAEETTLYGHPGQADLIGVVAQPGVSPTEVAARVRSAVSGKHLTVLAGTSRGAAENLAAAQDVSNLTSLGGSAVPLVLMSLFVVASTVALSVAGRARTMALLRAIGATPGQVRRMVMAELFILGVLAGFVGWLPGTWLASFSVRGLIAHQVAPPSAHAWASPVELVPSVIFGVVIAELAGFFAARRASRIHPASALEEASIERRYPRPLRLVIGVAALGGGAVLSVVALNQADASQQLIQAQFVLLAFMGGVAFLGPYLMTLAEVVLRLPVRLVGGTAGRLASAEVRARSRRMAAAAVAIALPVTFAGAIWIVDATAIHGSAIESHQRLAASAVVSAASPGLDPSVLTAVRSQPGVSAAVGFVPTTVYVGSPGAENASGEAVTSGPLRLLLHLGVISGNLSNFGPGDIALSTIIAGKGGMNAHIGEVITTYLADGTPYRAKVTAIFSRSLGFADVLIPAGAAGGGHLGASGLGEVLVGRRDGFSSASLQRELESLTASYPGLRVASRTVANAQYELLTSQTSYINDLLLGLVALLAGVALINTLVMATLQGRDELNLLRRVGATVRQLLAVTTWQAGQVSVVGILTGVAAAAPAVVGVSKALTGSWTPYISPVSVVVILGPVVALTGLAMIVPTVNMIGRGRKP